MLKEPTLYLESTVISYLAAFPSRDLIVAGHQQVTQEWWDKASFRFKLFISEVVLEEVSRGDRQAAEKRLQIVSGLPILTLTSEVKFLALEYQQKLGLPAKAMLDVIHLAYAVAYKLDFLLTWNCAHLANGIIISKLQTLNNISGRKTPVIVTPEELLELPEGG